VSNPRLMAIFDDLVTSIKDVIRKQQVKHEEYRQAVAFAQELAGAGEMVIRFRSDAGQRGDRCHGQSLRCAEASGVVE
jgi:hypothetical protein